MVCTACDCYSWFISLYIGPDDYILQCGALVTLEKCHTSFTNESNLIQIYCTFEELNNEEDSGLVLFFHRVCKHPVIHGVGPSIHIVPKHKLLQVTDLVKLYSVSATVHYIVHVTGDQLGTRRGAQSSYSTQVQRSYLGIGLSTHMVPKHKSCKSMICQAG
jgi:hypothetical protein